MTSKIIAFFSTISLIWTWCCCKVSGKANIEEQRLFQKWLDKKNKGENDIESH